MNSGKIFYSDLKVLLNLYLSKAFVLCIFDPNQMLIEDAPINWGDETANTKVLINLGENISTFKGIALDEFDLIIDFGKTTNYEAKYTQHFNFLNDSNHRMKWLYANGKLDQILTFYNDSGLRGKTISWGLKVAHRLGLDTWVNSGQVSIKAKQMLETAKLCKLKKGDTLSIFTGTEGTQRTALLAVHNKGTLQNMIKVPTTEEALVCVRREKNNLEFLANTRFNTMEIPKCYYSPMGILNMNKVGDLNAKKTSNFTSNHALAVLEMNTKNQQVKPLQSTTVWERALDDLWFMKHSKHKEIKHLAKKIRTLMAQLDKNKKVLTTMSHGDFTPWNMLHSPEKLFVYDWELYRDDAPALYDVFHFIFQREILMHQSSHSQIKKVIKQTFSNHISLRRFALKHHMSVELCQKLYLVSAASYFGKVYCNQELSKQNHWQLKAWGEAITALTETTKSIASRREFIYELNAFLQDKKHAFLKFNFRSLDEVPVSSDLDIAVEKKQMKDIIEFCSSKPVVSKMNINKRSFMTTIELHFENDEYLSLDFIYQFKRKALEYMNINSVLDQAQKNSSGVYRPALQHDVEYSFLFYHLNGAQVPTKYYTFFAYEPIELQHKAIRYLNLKFKTEFTRIKDVFLSSKKPNRNELKNQVRKQMNQGLIQRFSNTVNYVLDTLSNIRRNKGFIITFSGVDGAGKSTLIHQVQKQLESKYRREVVLLRHRPGLLPMLNSIRHGKKQAEYIASTTLPRQGKNKSVVSSLFRFSYYFLDYLLGQVYIYGKYLIRGKIVLYDRYYFDFINDPRRSNISLSKRFIKALYKFIFKPRLNIFLYANPSVILSRKKELKAEDIVALSNGYRTLFSELNEKSTHEKYIAVENIELNATLESILNEYRKVA